MTKNNELRPYRDAPALQRPVTPQLRDIDPWFGSPADKLRKRAEHARADTDFLDARRGQSEAMIALIDSLSQLSTKIAEIDAARHELQQDRSHQLWLRDQARENERAQVLYEFKVSLLKRETELARALEELVRTQRNLEAAERTKQAQIDKWSAEAQARTNNARAEHEDTLADLNATTGPNAERPGRSSATDTLATLDHQIDLERQRGNEAAVQTLLNLRARLTA